MLLLIFKKVSIKRSFQIMGLLSGSEYVNYQMRYQAKLSRILFNAEPALTQSTWALL